MLFFDPGTSTIGYSPGVTVEGTSSSLAHTTGEVAVVGVADSKSATCPVEGPGTGVLATQPVEAPSAGTATQPVEAPGAGPDVLLTDIGNAALHAEQTSTSGKTVDITGRSVGDNFRDSSPDRDFTRDESTNQELSEEASYRETIRGMRYFMGWHQIPEFNSVSSADDNLFASFRVQPIGKVSVKLPIDDWLCRKMEKFSITIT